MQKKSTWKVQTSNKADLVCFTRGCGAFEKVGVKVGGVERNHHCMASAESPQRVHGQRVRMAKSPDLKAF